MRPFFQALVGQLGRVVLVRRYRWMTGILLVSAFLTMEVYRAEVVTELPVAVVDLDNSSLSRTLRLFLDSSREVRVVEADILSQEDARRMFVESRIAGFLLIPQDFSEKIKKGHKAELLSAVDMSNILIGKTVQKAFSQSAGLVAAGVQMKLQQKLGETKRSALARTAPLVVVEDRPFNPFGNYTTYVVPGMVFFLINVWVLLLTCAVFREGQRPSSGAGVLGALVGVLVLGVAMGLIGTFLYLPREHIFVQSSFGLMLAALSCFVTTAILMATALNLLIPSSLLALELTMVLGMLSLMFSGVTWPTDMFPGPIAALATFIPFAPFAQAFQMYLHHPVGFAELGSKFAQFGAQALLYSAIALFGVFWRWREAGPSRRRPQLSAAGGGGSA